MKAELTCCVCGVALPNKWAVAKREVADGEERHYCHLHANPAYGATKKEKGAQMALKEEKTTSLREEEIVRTATDERVKKAWSECASLASRLGGGIKTLWGKIHPDRSPEAMLKALNADLSGNGERLAAVKPELDRLYREIVAKKREYQNSSPIRQRLLKVELQTLMARYKGFEREFTILSENARSIETVKSRFLEILAYDLRGKLNARVVDRLVDDIESEADEAEDVQDALSDLERAGARKERSNDDFEDELAGFDVEPDVGTGEDLTDTNKEKESTNENADENPDAIHDDGIVA